MQNNPDNLDASQPGSWLEQIQRVCRRFEAAWEAAPTQLIEDYLDIESPTEDSVAHRELLVELVGIDLEHRWRLAAESEVAGEVPSQATSPLPARPRLAEYVTRFPALGLLEQLPVELIGREYRARHLWGDRPDHEEYVGTFAAQLPKLDETLLQIDEELKSPGDDEIAAAPDHILGPDNGGEPATMRSWDSAPSADQRFRILRSHAEGGLGRVSVADDTELHREVAIKELHACYTEDPHRRARFMLEAEITGSLEHPGIVPVYGLGQYADGRPFYAMRFIRGDNLKAAIEKYHQADASGHDPGQRTLGLRKLLGHFIDVCNAIQYAHSRGILHRDLKPSNIMLGKHGETLVVDWGLAKAVGRSGAQVTNEEKTLHPASGSAVAATHMGSAIGTPAYMCPEQAKGRLDELGPASDVYSLGATLYCLLTGHAPVKGENVSTVLEKVQQGDFPRPREINPQVPPPLEDICLKAMALDPKGRYATGRMLAEDIERWLADEPVSAHRETSAERMGRWMRRHRSWTLAGVAILLVVATVSVAATFLINGARQAEQAARENALILFREARKAVDYWTTGAAEILVDYPGKQRESKRLFEAAAEAYERFVKQTTDNVELETERGRAYLRLGDARRFLRQLAEAEEAYRSAQSLFAELCERHPKVRACKLGLANSRTSLGLILADVGDHKNAELKYDSAISALRALAQAHSGDPEIDDALATSLLNRASLIILRGSDEEGEEILRQTAREFEELMEADPDESRFVAGLATARTALGQVLIRKGRNDDAVTEFNQAIAAFDALLEKDPRNPEYLDSSASAKVCLAAALRSLGQYAKELNTYQEAIDDYQALTEAFSDVPQYAENLALTRTDLGQLLYQLGRTAEAEAELGQALLMFGQLTTNNPLTQNASRIPRYSEERAACRDILGRVLSDLGRNDEAKLGCESAVRTYQGLAGAFPDVPQYKERLAVSQSHLGQVLHKLGNHTAANEAYQTTIIILEGLIQFDPQIPAYHNELAFVNVHLGVLLRETGETRKAEEAFRQARKLWRHLTEQLPLPEYSHNLAWFLVNCADPQFRTPDQAIQYAQRVRTEVPQNATYCNTLGVAHYRAGNWQESISAFHEAIRLRQEGNGRDWFFLAMAQWRQGNLEDAAESFKKACRWMKEHRPDNPQLRRIHNEAAKLLGSSEQGTRSKPQTDP